MFSSPNHQFDFACDLVMNQFYSITFYIFAMNIIIYYSFIIVDFITAVYSAPNSVRLSMNYE